MASANLLDGELQQRGGRDIRSNTNMIPAVTLQNTDDRHFAGCCAAPLAFAPPPKQASSSSISPPGKLKSAFSSLRHL
jgi:hypothetical protein